MIDHDDVRFTAFTRDLARRHRRPRSFPPSPARPDVLEQLCGGMGLVPPGPASLPQWPETIYGYGLTDDLVDSIDAVADLDDARDSSDVDLDSN